MSKSPDDGARGGGSSNSSSWKIYNGYRVPDPADCMTMPRKYRSASNDVLCVLAAQGLPGARRERLLREIMAKDNVSWPVAREKLYEINVYNDRFGLVREGARVCAHLRESRVCWPVESALPVECADQPRACIVSCSFATGRC